jgi:tetratricopeptide (TPR) repeat protein
MNEGKKINGDQTADNAMKAYQSKDYLEAALLFGEAAQAYAGDADPLRSAEMRNNQSVALLQAGKAEESFKVVEGTDQVFAHADDKKRQAMALANMGAALAEMKQKDDAIKAYEESSSLLQELGESDLRLDVQRSLSILLMKKREFTDAVMEMQDGLMDAKKPTLKQRILKKLLFMRLWK